jgi:hypothetical protein
MIRRWNVVLTSVANGPHQVTAITSMVELPIRRFSRPATKPGLGPKPAAAKTRIIRPATILAAGLPLSA